MLTLLKKIFTWWNQDTFGTRIKTILFGKFVGQDSFGNKYYESKNGKRWVIYSGEIDASKIPVEWYSWIHHTQNKIEIDNNPKCLLILNKGKKISRNDRCEATGKKFKNCCGAL